MKKVLISLLILFMTIVPFTSPVLADNNSEDKKVNVYVFKGKTCDYCKKFLEWANSLSKEQKSKFNLYEYEVWYNEKNNTAMNEVAKILEGEVPERFGVPYIIVGKKTWNGFDEIEYGPEILAAINEAYESNEKIYDVIKENNLEVYADEIIEVKPVNNNAIILMLALVIIGGICLAFVIMLQFTQR